MRPAGFASEVTLFLSDRLSIVSPPDRVGQPCPVSGARMRKRSTPTSATAAASRMRKCKVGMIAAIAKPGIERAEQDEMREAEKPQQIPGPLGGGNSRRGGRVEPGKPGHERGAQALMNLLRGHAAVRVGGGGVGLRQRGSGCQEQLALTQDAAAVEPPVALVEDARAQRPRLEIGRERVARVGLGDGVVQRSVVIGRTLAAAQHVPQYAPSVASSWAQKGPGRPSKFASITKIGS